MRERNAFEKSLLGNKRALQGGVYNYLGKQKTVNAPLKWKSSPEHPVAYLTYITKEEADILIKKNIYGSLKNGKPNKGPFGIASLQGSGGGSGGDGDSGGSSGGDSGGSTGGDSGGGSGGDSGGGAAGAAGAAGTSDGTSDDSDTNDTNDTTNNTTDTNEDTSPTSPSFDTLDTISIENPPMETMVQEQPVEEQTPPSYSMARLSPIGIAAYNMSLANPTRTTAEKAVGFATSPISTIAATIADTSMRGVTAPNDYSQVTDSVQTSISPSVDTGGIGSFENTYKPLDSSNAYIPYTRKPFFTMDPLTGVFKSLI
jgi:hypothetical protein